MEILQSIAWIALGIVPTLAMLEMYDRLRKKEDNTKSCEKGTNPNHDIAAVQLSVINGKKCRFRSTSGSKKNFGTS